MASFNFSSGAFLPERIRFPAAKRDGQFAVGAIVLSPSILIGCVSAMPFRD